MGNVLSYRAVRRFPFCSFILSARDLAKLVHFKPVILYSPFRLMVLKTLVINNNRKVCKCFT